MSGEPVTYQISGEAGDPVGITTLNFQHGPVPEVGLNGISNEVLMAIVLDRLAFYQKGAFACRENALAYTKIEEGLLWLHKRTWDRMQRNVEGTLKV